MDRDAAAALDRADPLAPARAAFRLPEGVLHLNGNSLGPLQTGVAERVARTVTDEWGDGLKRSWNDAGWAHLPRRVAGRLAPIIGAAAHEVAVADSTSVDLFKAVVAARRLRPDRRVILTDDRNFPSDAYVVAGVADLLSDTEVAVVAPEEVESRLDASVAVLTLTHVDYRSGRLHDAARLTAAAHDAGAVTVWDLSHSAGAVALDLAGCDLAVGCGYKYLNGGPGAPAFLFVAEALQDQLRSPLPGWMGHAEPFAFDTAYRPAPGIARFLTGTPSILALAALDAGLDTFEGVATADLEAKQQRLTQVFVEAVEARCGGEVRLAGSRDPAQRGSHVSFAHPGGYAVVQALIARGVVGDFRAPDLMRFGFAPLYNRFEDAWRAAQALGEVLASREWDQPHFLERARVT